MSFNNTNRHFKRGWGCFTAVTSLLVKAALFRNLSDKPSSSSNAGDTHSPSGVDVRMFQHGNKNTFFFCKRWFFSSRDSNVYPKVAKSDCYCVIRNTLNLYLEFSGWGVGWGVSAVRVYLSRKQKWEPLSPPGHMNTLLNIHFNSLWYQDETYDVCLKFIHWLSGPVAVHHKCF